MRARKHGENLALGDAMEAIYRGRPLYKLASHHQDLLESLNYLITKDETYLKLIKEVVRKGATVLLHQHKLRVGLKKMSNNSRKMVRSIADWKPPRGNSRNRFGNLLRHVFFKYKVPRCMENAWLNGNDEDRAFILNLGQAAAVYGHPYLKALSFPAR